MHLQDTCLRRLREETERHGAFEDWDDATSTADGASTRPISSAGTPLPQPKINLKLGARKSAAKADLDSMDEQSDSD